MKHHSGATIALLGFVADAVTTFIGIGSMGLTETNPLMRGAMAFHGIAAGIFILSVVTFLIIYTTAELGRRSNIPGTETGATLGLFSVGLLKFGFAGWNSVLILSV